MLLHLASRESNLGVAARFAGGEAKVCQTTMANPRNALLQSDDDVELNLSIPVKALIEEFACPICFNNIKVTRAVVALSLIRIAGLLHHNLRT